MAEAAAEAVVDVQVVWERAPVLRAKALGKLVDSPCTTPFCDVYSVMDQRRQASCNLVRRSVKFSTGGPALTSPLPAQVTTSQSDEAPAATRPQPGCTVQRQSLGPPVLLSSVSTWHLALFTLACTPAD